MAKSWMIVEKGGVRVPVGINSWTHKGVKAAVRRAVRSGRSVVDAYLGRRGSPIALSTRVEP